MLNFEEIKCSQNLKKANFYANILRVINYFREIPIRGTSYRYLEE